MEARVPDVTSDRADLVTLDPHLAVIDV